MFLFYFLFSFKSFALASFDFVREGRLKDFFFVSFFFFFFLFLFPYVKRATVIFKGESTLKRCRCNTVGQGTNKALVEKENGRIEIVRWIKEVG